MNQFRRPTRLDPKKCPVYLYLPWLSNVSIRYEMQIKTAVKRCYFVVEPCIVNTTRQLLPTVHKNVLPASHQSNMVYQFLFHCDSWYVGHTFQRLQRGLSSTYLNPFFKDLLLKTEAHSPALASQSEISFFAIGQHLLQNPSCAHEYNNGKFSILVRGRTSFHLSTLKATYIKTSKLNLCKQKEYAYGLKIAR